MAKDEEYEAAVKKGSRLLEMLSSGESKTSQHQAQSPTASKTKFTAVEDLFRYGYTNDLTSSKSGRRVLKRLERALQALNINAEMVIDGGENTLIEHQHLEDRNIDGIHCPATFATFVQICNPADGALIAYNNSTPEHAGPLQDLPVLDVPPLHHWSDVAYLQWLSASSPLNITSSSHPTTTARTPPIPDIAPPPQICLAPIKYIFRLTIQNTPTISILNKIMIKHNYPGYSAWPGRSFSIDSEEGKAIVGTPNGAGVAWLLAQHKRELRSRKIEKVTVFCAENDEDICRWPSLCFWIV